MNYRLKQIAFVLGLPIAAIIAGIAVQWATTDRAHTAEILAAAPESDRAPLYSRWRGYTVDAVDRYWRPFDQRAKDSERIFLLVDMTFPVFYGAAFLLSFRRARACVRKGSGPIYSLASFCAIGAVVADWTENAIQLQQLRLYDDLGHAGLQSLPIRIASLATTAKLVFFFSALGFIVWATVEILFRYRDPKSL